MAYWDDIEREIKRAADGTPVEFMGAARIAAEDVARAQRYFTIDDVWPVLESRGVTFPHKDHRSGVGQILLDMKREKLIRPTDRYENSRRQHNHQVHRVWESLMYGGGVGQQSMGF